MAILKYSLFFFILFSFNSISDWELIDQSDVKDVGRDHGWIWKYKDFKCADSNNCFALIEVGGIWLWNRITTDGGDTWYSQNMDTTILKLDENNDIISKRKECPRIKRCSYSDPSLCIVTADSGIYYKSTNQGRDWEKHYLPTEKNLYRVDFLDKNKGVIYSYGKFYITSNCFEDYSIQEVYRPDEELVTHIQDMKVIKPQSIITLAYNTERNDFILRSDDWGKSWKYYNTIESRVNEIYFIDSLEGWACGNPNYAYNDVWRRDLVLHTIDGGKTWETQLDTLVVSKTGLDGIDFWDKNNGIVWGWANKLWRTSDGGNTWIHDTSANSERFGDFLNLFQMTGDNEYIGTSLQFHSIWRYQDNEVSVIDRNLNSKKSEISIYPNPSEGQEINIKFNSPYQSIFSISIFNSYGLRISDEFIGELTDGQILRYTFPQELTPGVYFLRIRSGGQVETSKFVVVR